MFGKGYVADNNADKTSFEEGELLSFHNVCSELDNGPFLAMRTNAEEEDDEEEEEGVVGFVKVPVDGYESGGVIISTNYIQNIYTRSIYRS